MKKFYKWQIILPGLILVFSCLHLEADPSIFKWNGDPGPLSDESMWTHSARVSVLFGKYLIPPDSCSHALFGGPLFTILSRLSFMIGGVHLSSVRSLTVLSFWVTLGILFQIFQKSGYTSYASMMPVVILGLNHEAIMESRWATPTFLEILFLSSCFLFLIRAVIEGSDRSPIRRRVYLAVAGISFSGAVASKLSAVIMIPTFGVMILFTVFPLRKIPLMDLVWFFTGSLFGGGLLGIFFLQNLPQWEVFLRTIRLTQGSLFLANFNLITALHQVFTNSAISNPMVAPMAIGVMILFVVRIQEAWKSRSKLSLQQYFKKLEPLEALAFCWLIVGLGTFLFHPDRFINRRFILFLIPLSILFSKLILRFNRSESVSGVIAAVFTGAWMFYFPEMIHYLSQVWLSKIDIHFEPNLAALYKIEIFLALPIFLILYKTSIDTLLRFLAFGLIVINLSMNIYWMLHPTFTFRDESIRLASLTLPGELNTGYMPWVFSLETKMRPVFFMKKEHYTEYNADFREVVWDYTNSLVVIRGKVDHKPSLYYDSYFLNPEDFPGMKQEPLGTFKLAPYPGTNIYRIEADILRIHKRST